MGVPRRVVFRKPNIKMPINTKEKKKLNTSNVPEVPEQEEIDIPDVIEIPKIEIPELRTKSGRAILMKKEPEPKPEIKEIKKELPKDMQKEPTFDEKFLDRMNIKSRITKDQKTLDKLTTQKPQPKQKIKKKRKLTKSSLISLFLFIITVGWIYKVIKDYMNHALDGSLASFVYIISLFLFALIMIVWFIIEITMEDKDGKR